MRPANMLNTGTPMRGAARGPSTGTDRRPGTAARRREDAPIDGGGPRGTERYVLSSAARREFGIVFGLAFSGIASVLLVAFTPWYDSVTTAGETDGPAAHISAPVASAGEVGAGPARLASGRP